MQDFATNRSPQEIKFIRQTLTGILVEINAVLGLEAALKVAERYGGKRLYLSWRKDSLTRNGGLAKLLGYEAALLLVERCSGRNLGGSVEVEHGPYGVNRVFQWQAIKLFADGKSARFVAHKLRVPRGTVKGWKQRFLEDEAANGNVRPSANDNGHKRSLIKAAGYR